MAVYDYDLVVIGGGAAGLTCATGASKLGARTLLVEKEDRLGGGFLHFGCIPSKTLIKTAAVYQSMKNSERFGLPRVEVPPVDFKAVSARIRRVQALIQRHHSPQWIKDHYGAVTRFGQARFVDSHTIEIDGKPVTSKNFVLATGAHSKVPRIEGLDKVDYFTSETIFSIEHLPASMIVLGGGTIGSEIAQAFSRLGTRVTIVESGDHLLPREDADVADFIQQVLLQENVKVLAAHEAVSVRRDGKKIRMRLLNRQTSDESEVSAEAFFIATGRRPNVETLALDWAGVKVGKWGVPVNSRLQTNIKHIYACGDVNGGLQFTHVASYEAGVVLANTVLHVPLKVDYQQIPWVTYLDPEVASVGYNEVRARAAGINYDVEIEKFGRNDRALAEETHEGFMKILLNKKRRPVGVQIVGPHAGDLLGEWIAVLAAKIPLSKVARTVHPYPTFSEINKNISGNALAPYFFNNPIVRFLSSF